MSKVKRENYRGNRVYQVGPKRNPYYEVTNEKGKVVQRFNDLNEAREFNKGNVSKIASTNKINTTPYKLPISDFDSGFLEASGYSGLPDTSNIVFRNSKEMRDYLLTYDKYRKLKTSNQPSTADINAISSSRSKFNKTITSIENIKDDEYSDDIDYTVHFNKKIRELELEYNKLIALDPESKNELDAELNHARALADYHKETIEEHGKGYWSRLFFKTIDTDEPDKPARK